MIEFTKKDILIVILASIFLSFGITIPLGIVLLIIWILRKINSIKLEKKFNTSFVN